MMSRWIDADELLSAFGEIRADYNCFNELERPRYEMWSNAIDFINAMARSSIDIVRCKECKYWDTEWIPASEDADVHWCSYKDLVEYGDWFCADGERIE